jgi:hypothetical protein
MCYSSPSFFSSELSIIGDMKINIGKINRRFSNPNSAYCFNTLSRYSVGVIPILFLKHLLK